MKKLVASVLVSLAAISCTPAQEAKAVTDVRTAEADLLEGLPIACTIADVIDPTGATVICAILDASGAALSTVTKALPTPAIAAAVVAAHPAGALAVSLKAAARKP
jgi:hypothetical protein